VQKDGEEGLSVQNVRNSGQDLHEAHEQREQPVPDERLPRLRRSVDPATVVRPPQGNVTSDDAVAVTLRRAGRSAD
jgi:hypothetical protein